MLKQLKRALVESYVGAIALGYILAQSILHFVDIFTTPVASWIMRNEYGELASRSMTKSFSFKDAIPGVLSFVLLALIWYVSMRWLYFRSMMPDTIAQPSAQDPNP